MKRILAAILCTALALVALAGCGQSAQPAAPQEERTEPLVFKFGNNGSGSDNDPMGYPARRFMELVEEKTDGMITFEFYPNAQLGTESDMMDQVLGGTLDFGMISSSVLATSWEELYFYSMPFAFGSLEEFWDICGADNKEFVDAMRQVVDGSGLAHFVASFHTSPRGCQNTTRPIRTPEDFQGLTFRVMAGEIYTDTFRALGASTSTIPFAELYTSLQTGVCQGEDLSPFFFYDNKYYEVEKYLTEIGMIQNVAPLIVSTDAWAQLTEAERQIIYEAAAEAEKESLATINRMSQDVYEKLAAEGVEIIRYTDLTEEEIAANRQAATSVWDKYREKMGEELFALLPSQA